MIAEYVEVTKSFPHTDGSPTGDEFWVLLNDGTVEGVAAASRFAFSVQYHPESSPGPHDSLYLFERFRDEIARFRAETA